MLRTSSTFLTSISFNPAQNTPRPFFFLSSCIISFGGTVMEEFIEEVEVLLSLLDDDIDDFFDVFLADGDKIALPF